MALSPLFGFPFPGCGVGTGMDLEALGLMTPPSSLDEEPGVGTCAPR